MALQYDVVIRKIYEGNDRKTSDVNRGTKVTPVKYMEIPIKDEFELPTFALNYFLENIHNHPDVDALVVPVYSYGDKPYYVTLNRYMQDVLLERYDHLIEMTMPDGVKKYYGIQGTVFNKDLEPLLMCSWQVRRELNDDSEDMKYKYKLIRPILRIHPRCFQMQSDPMEKFIAKKFPTEIINTGNISVFGEGYLLYDNVRRPIKIEIDRSPFVLKEIDTPSVSITDDSLLQIARDHIDEIIP